MPFQIDHSHSEIQFSARHMMVSKVRGVFEKWDGTIALDPPTRPRRPSTSRSTPPASTPRMRSVTVTCVRRLSERREVPFVTFKSTKVDVTGDNTAKLTGDLTIAGVTKPAVLDVEYQGNAKSPWGTTNYGFSAHTKINREDRGLTWNAALETGGWLVGKEISIDIELELIQVAEPEKVAAAA